MRTSTSSVLILLLAVVSISFCQGSNSHTFLRGRHGRRRKLGARSDYDTIVGMLDDAFRGECTSDETTANEASKEKLIKCSGGGRSAVLVVNNGGNDPEPKVLTLCEGGKCEFASFAAGGTFRDNIKKVDELLGSDYEGSGVASISSINYQNSDNFDTLTGKIQKDPDAGVVMSLNDNQKLKTKNKNQKARYQKNLKYREKKRNNRIRNKKKETKTTTYQKDNKIRNKEEETKTTTYQTYQKDDQATNKEKVVAVSGTEYEQVTDLLQRNFPKGQCRTETGIVGQIVWTCYREGSSVQVFARGNTANPVLSHVHYCNSSQSSTRSCEYEMFSQTRDNVGIVKRIVGGGV